MESSLTPPQCVRRSGHTASRSNGGLRTRSPHPADHARHCTGRGELGTAPDDVLMSQTMVSRPVPQDAGRWPAIPGNRRGLGTPAVGV
jgi:hypothetical protein